MEELQRFEIRWQGIDIEILYSPDWLNCFRETYHVALGHLEIRSLHPERAPLPITETGYRSRFDNPEDIDQAGGPEAFVRAWLEEAAQSPEWKSQQAEQRQLSLFGMDGPT